MSKKIIILGSFCLASSLFGWGYGGYDSYGGGYGSNTIKDGNSTYEYQGGGTVKRTTTRYVDGQKHNVEMTYKNGRLVETRADGKRLDSSNIRTERDLDSSIRQSSW